MQREVRCLNRIDQIFRFSAGVDEVRFRRRERLHADGHAAVCHTRHGALENCRGEVECLLGRERRQGASAAWRPKDHQVATQIACRLQRDDRCNQRCWLGPVASGEVRCKAIRAGKQPVQPDDLDARISGLCAQLGRRSLETSVIAAQG